MGVAVRIQTLIRVSRHSHWSTGPPARRLKLQFGPKLIATRGYFQDRALESRCLTEEMGGRKLREDVPINLGAEYKNEAAGAPQ
jgi:hypothetical protein